MGASGALILGCESNGECAIPEHGVGWRGTFIEHQLLR